jgi:CoA:oxalate CoA-transferase
MFVNIEHPVDGNTTLTGNHFKFSEKKAEIRTPSQLLASITLKFTKNL